MTDEERVRFGEIEERTSNNAKAIEMMRADISDMRDEHKALYSLATSVEVLVQHVNHIDEKIDSTNEKIDKQAEMIADQGRRIADAEKLPLEKGQKHSERVWAAIEGAIITVVISLAGTGLIWAIINNIK